MTDQDPATPDEMAWLLKGPKPPTLRTAWVGFSQDLTPALIVRGAADKMSAAVEAAGDAVRLAIMPQKSDVPLVSATMTADLAHLQLYGQDGEPLGFIQAYPEGPNRGKLAISNCETTLTITVGVDAKLTIERRAADGKLLNRAET